MKTKKKLISLLLVAVMCIGSLAACGKNNSGDEGGSKTDGNVASNNDNKGTDVKTPDDSASENNVESKLPEMTTANITITYMHFDNEDLVKAVAAAFMEKYPNIKVETAAYSTDGYNDTLLNMVNAQMTPDCFMILGNCDFALSNAILGDMTEYWENDPENENVLPTINSAKLGYYGTDKKLASPIKFFPDAIYCDINVFESLNINPPKVDWSMDDMVQAIKNATNPTAGTYGFNQYHSLITYYPVAANGNCIGEFGWNGTTFDMADWAEGVNLWASLMNGKFHAPAFDSDENEAWTGDRTMWAGNSGKLGFQLDAWWTYLNLFDTPDYRTRGMEWVPYTTPANSEGTVFGVLDFGGISTGTKYPREAYELLKWMGWGVDGWKAKLEAYKTLQSANGTPLYRQAMPCPITMDEGIWEEFAQSFYPTEKTRTYQSVNDPVNNEALVSADEDQKYGKYFDYYFANCRKVVPFGDCQIPGFISFLTTSYFAVGDTPGVEDQVRNNGANANDFVEELTRKANEANRAALDSAKEAYSYLGIELNY